MKNKVKNLMLIILGGVIFTSIGVIGSNVITANQVGINSSKTNKTNIQDAIDELYIKANKKNIIHGKAAVSTGKTVVTSGLPAGVKAIIYLDPTDLSKSCTASNSVSTTGTKTGCMKWYAYLEDSDSYTMILDHNTTATIQWNSNNSNMYPATIQPEIDKLITESGWKVTPRMISAQEIANITGNTTWTPGGSYYYFDSNSTTPTATSQGTSLYAWLFDYTNGCISYGCNIEDSSTNGYWASTAYDNSDGVWLVYIYGYLGVNQASNTTFGLRPVITILK